MRRRNSSRFEVLCWSVGLLCLLVSLSFRAESEWAARAARRFGLSPTAAATPAPHHPEPRHSNSPDLAAVDGVIGRLEVPELGLRVPILNNYDLLSLQQGVGRIRGTGLPGGLGNFVLAGHRDTFFRPLRRVTRGMKMHVVTADGGYDYLVDATSIVAPSDLDVLDVGDRPEMTLITCYPFDYIGPAPRRFIVRAHLVSVASTE